VFLVILLTNKQTNTGENIIFLVEVKMIKVVVTKFTTGT